MPLALCREEPGTYREHLPRVEFIFGSGGASRTDSSTWIDSRTKRLHHQDEPARRSAATNGRGQPPWGGRHGPVLRWNPKTRERSVDQLVWGLLPHDTEDPTNALRPIMARADAFGAEEAELTPAGLYPSVTGSAGRRRPAVSHRDAVKPELGGQLLGRRADALGDRRDHVGGQLRRLLSDRGALGQEPGRAGTGQL